MLNDEGWVLTAFHILQLIDSLARATAEYQKYERERSAIDRDDSLSPGEKRRRLTKLRRPPPSAVTNHSSWWGWDGVGIAEAHGIEPIDLGVARLSKFDKSWVRTYPFLKDPTKGMRPGTSLCKLGFPFHAIEPKFDPQKNAFVLPAGAVPLPFFPLEGIYTRQVVLGGISNAPSYPLQFLETSSPGLLGQSSGPTFDTRGTVWAIQSRTQHFPLGFGGDLKGSQLSAKQQEFLRHQYLNVGWGVHSETVIGLLRARGIRFQLSGT